ncbi:hypothetical protein HOT45_gp28 [Gordonia phage Trine]|uniref:Uncharacterized protein n=1 Tax=Gordonia phage Trine TaxID=2201431 RepID=A0A2Z4Q989_9CAUD|nr:hypothetical protein HOT45_gp28 [Gordonia phage Trine]AWY06530.1 hypothetical protein PBI_TRINE_28 [Gordonia phage Trine]
MTNPFLNNAPAAAAQAPTQAPAAAAAQAPIQSPVNSADPFAAPTGGGDGARITDDLNQALLIRPTEYIEHIQTSNTKPGEKSDAVRADWIVLTGPNAGQVRSGSLIFQKVLKAELKRIIGSAQPMMVAWLGLGEARGGNNAPYIFGAADDQTRALAMEAAKANNWI